MKKFNFNGRGKGKRASAKAKMSKGAVCMRCGKRMGDDLARFSEWNGEWKDGVLAGLVCPDCQTSEEYIMAEAEAVTSLYTVGDDGRVRQYPKL